MHFHHSSRGIVSAVLCGLAIAASTTQVRGQDTDAPLFDYREKTLDNGLRVLTLEDPSCPVVNVQLWYHVGSKDEQPDRQGFAHMFEHMMFRGTDRLGPTDHFDLIRRVGGTCNAYTSFDQTVYHETLPADQLELALWLEAERMAFLKINQEGFDTERKVVEEERRLGLNRPFGSVAEGVMAEVFHEHPYRWTPIGNIPNLRAASVAELRDFWQRYYVPNNATLVIAGDIKHDEAQKLAEKYFGWIPRGADPPRVTVKEPLPTEGRSITIREPNAPAPLVGMIYRSPSQADDDSVPLELLVQILVGDDSSRLYRELVANKKLAVQTISFNNVLEQDGMLLVGAVLSPFGARPADVLAELKAQVAAFSEKPVTEEELTKARNQLLKETVARNLTVEGKARVLGSAAVLEGDASRANQRLDQIRSATADDLMRVAKKYLDPDKALAMTVESAPDATKQAEEDAQITATPETTPPPVGRPDTVRPKDFPSSPPSAAFNPASQTARHQTRRLSNGMKLVVVPNHELPFVSVQIGLLYGAYTEAKPGAASMALGMLTKGSSKHTEAELADELGKYAITLQGIGEMDSAAVAATCLTEHLPRTLDLLAEVVMTPAFSQEEFDKYRKQLRTQLSVASNQPQYVAQRELRKQLFASHPYSREATGEVEDIDKLVRDDLVNWWTTYARPDAAVLLLAGDIDIDRAQKLADQAFSGWAASGQKPSVKLADPPSAAPTRIYLVDRKTATQSQILVGQLGIPFSDPGYFTSRIVNGYFGGAFNSRLNETIRVKKGLTYGARGGFNTQRFGGQFTVSTFSKTESTIEAVAAVFDELRRLAAEAPSDDELKNTAAYLLGSFAINRETPQKVAEDAWDIEVNGLPEDFFEQELKGVAATDRDDCMELIRKAVDPDKMVVVVVGKAKELKEGLEKIAPVTVISAK